VTHQPANEFIAKFVGVETILTGRVIKKEGGTFVATVEGRRSKLWAAPVGEAVILCIRPENVILSTNPSRETTSARNVFPGKIDKIVSLGLYQKVLLDCGFPMVAYVTNHSLGKLSLGEGKEVTASFKATAIHVIRKREK
jgi:tungstate transport system ATP-binding protein